MKKVIRNIISVTLSVVLVSLNVTVQAEEIVKGKETTIVQHMDVDIANTQDIIEFENIVTIDDMDKIEVELPTNNYDSGKTSSEQYKIQDIESLLLASVFG